MGSREWGVGLRRPKVEANSEAGPLRRQEAEANAGAGPKGKPQERRVKGGRKSGQSIGNRKRRKREAEILPPPFPIPDFRLHQEPQLSERCRPLEPTRPGDARRQARCR